MVRKGFAGALPMTREEAEEHRLELIEVRSAFKDGTDMGWRGA